MVVLNVVGLNCGTSVDGIDTALVTIESVQGTDDVAITLRSYSEYPVAPALRSRILALCRPGSKTTLEEVCDLNFELGEVFAEAVENSGIDLDHVDLIASHGQTLWHTPVAVEGNGYSAGERRMATLQMSESAVLANRTGITVADGFRVAELAAGRMGAPLSGFFEAAMMRDTSALRVSQNIGGMGNATVVPPSSRGTGYMAFDTGPGNVLIDCAVRVVSGGKEEYDASGARAAAGAAEVDAKYADNWLKLEYLTRAPPKTTGRELFSEAMGVSMVEELRARGLGDNAIVATITYLTAQAIVRALQDFVEPEYGNIDELYICGGGAANPTLMGYLSAGLPNSKITKLDDLSGSGMPAAAKEAVLFALLGFLTLCGRTVPVSSVEKAKQPAILGKITPGANYTTVMRAALQTEPSVLNRIIIK